MFKKCVPVSIACMLFIVVQAVAQKRGSDEYYTLLRHVEGILDTMHVTSIEDVVNRLREDVADFDVSCLRMVPNYLVFSDYGPGKFNAIRVRYGKLYILVFMLDQWHSARECLAFEGPEGEQVGRMAIDKAFRPVAIGLWEPVPHPFMNQVRTVYSIGEDGTTRRESYEYLFSDEILKKE